MLSTWKKSGQSPIPPIILYYNSGHLQAWMTFIATLMTVGEQAAVSLCLLMLV